MSSILILGATSDVGLALARKFAYEGFSISVAGRNFSEIEAIANDLSIKYNIQADAYLFDACDFKSHANFYQQLKIKPEISICVFGYMIDNQISIQNWEECNRVIETNFSGAVSICNHLALEYQKLKKGTIVGISSVAGDRGRSSNFIYGSAKAGFSAYLSGLRNLLSKSGVHVLTVKPGFMYTKMTENLPLPAIVTASPDDAAKAIYSACIKQKNIIYIKWFWRYIMLIIKSIPEFIFKKLSL